MKGKIALWKVSAALLTGIFCIGMARLHTVLVSEMGYTDPYGKEWKYKKAVSKVRPDNVRETYVVYTDKKQLTYDDVTRGMVLGCGCYSSDPMPRQYIQFYLVSKEWEAIPTPTPAVCYVNDAGTAFVDWEYEVFSGIFQTDLFPESYLEGMTREEAEELLAMDMVCDTFDYEDILDIPVSRLRLWTDGFRYQKAEDKLSMTTPRQGKMKEFLKERKKEIIKRAQKEKKEDFNYYEVKTIHKDLPVVSEVCIDFKEQVWRVKFSDEKDSGRYHCYVYIGFDGLTRRVSQEDYH